ncbi:MAG: thrombospondin type 3 repeat-containing protein [Muribaculaceae bacterium]|nr:thrombospondin type 3 repeat-containing protein [Muribaculaceae bacterium]
MDRAKIIIMAAATALNVAAQYPTIPDSIKDRGARMEAEWKALSDKAWTEALPIVMKEAEEGRPYRPWASKPEDLEKSDIPAFPGAEGGGAYTRGGRGGKVCVVTSLSDSGPGTLREAVEKGGARTIVFNVSGVIRLKSPIVARAPYVTILGQTAPGDGVCVTGASFLIDTHDVVIRHMRFRREGMDVAFRDDALGGNAVGNIILDHISASWGLDENMSIYRHVYNRDPETGKGQKLPTVNITIQNSIFSEALDLYNHAFGATIGGHNSTFARNLFASNISRNCSIGMDEDFNFINNVTYNWWNRTIDGGDHTSRLNIINNNFKPGPVTELNSADAPIRYRIIKMEAGRDKAHQNNFGKAYVNGNRVWGYDSISANNWAGGVQIFNKPVPAERIEELMADKPFPMADVTIMDANEAYGYVLENAGATRPVRDAVDARVIETVRSGKAIYAEDAEQAICSSPYVKRRLPDDSYKLGIITDPRQVGGLPEYKGEPRVDSDNDGLPDEWEKSHGLNPADPADSAKDSGNGYTWIEVYGNELADGDMYLSTSFHEPAVDNPLISSRQR